MKRKLINYFVAFIIPILIMLTGYIFLGIYPFGDKSILISDMSQQYVEFYGKFYDIFKSGNFMEIIYSWNAGMGDSFLTLMMYYLMSPLSYITLLFPKDYLPESLLIITLIKIGFCGVSFNYLLSFLFKNKNIYYTLIFSTMYALIGYNISYSFHIMWLDGIYLLPLVIVGVEKIISEKKWLLFCLSILLCFVSNFYISYMVGIYSFLYFIIQILLNYRIQEYQPILQRFRLFVVATFLAVGMAAIFLVPTAWEVLSNNGGESQIHYDLNSLILEMGNLGSKFLIGSYTTIKLGSPQLYCGIIVIPLLIVYFFNRKISRKEKIFYGSLVIFFVISFIDPSLNLLWHAGDIPNWFPSRFSFLFSFTILLMAYKGLVHIKDCKKSLNFIFVITGVLIITQMMISLLLKRLVSGAVFVSNACFIITLIFLVIYFFIFKGVLKSKKYSVYMIYAIVIMELLVNCTLILKDLDNEFEYINRDKYDINSRVEVFNRIPYDETTFYRLDNQLERTRNESLRLGYSGVSYFSSTANTKLHEFLLNMGLGGINIGIFTRGMTPLMDSLLDVRYRITSDGDIVENNALPLAFPVNSSILSYKSIPNDATQNQNHLFESIINSNGGEEKLYSPVGFEIESTQNLSYENNTYRKLNTTEPGYLNLLLDKNNIEGVFIQLKSSKDINIIINNEILNYNSWDNAIYLSEYNSNYIRIEMNDEVTNINDIRIYSLNQELLDKNIEILKKQNSPITIVNNNKVLIKGKFRDDEVLFTSIPFEKGWKAKIDGKSIPIESLEEALILINVPVGEHEIELYYLPQGLLLGGIISIIGIILFIMVIVFDYMNVYPTKKWITLSK